MTQYTDQEVKAVVDAIESEDVQFSLSDGYSFYTGDGKYYDKALKRIARKILKAIDKVRGK